MPTHFLHLDLVTTLCLVSLSAIRGSGTPQIAFNLEGAHLRREPQGAGQAVHGLVADASVGAHGGSPLANSPPSPQNRNQTLERTRSLPTPRGQRSARPTHRVGGAGEGREHRRTINNRGDGRSSSPISPPPPRPLAIPEQSNRSEWELHRADRHIGSASTPSSADSHGRTLSHDPSFADWNLKGSPSSHKSSSTHKSLPPSPESKESPKDRNLPAIKSPGRKGEPSRRREHRGPPERSRRSGSQELSREVPPRGGNLARNPAREPSPQPERLEHESKPKSKSKVDRRGRPRQRADETPQSSGSSGGERTRERRYMQKKRIDNRETHEQQQQQPAEAVRRAETPHPIRTGQSRRDREQRGPATTRRTEGRRASTDRRESAEPQTTKPLKGESKADSSPASLERSQRDPERRSATGSRGSADPSDRGQQSLSPDSTAKRSSSSLTRQHSGLETPQDSTNHPSSRGWPDIPRMLETSNTERYELTAHYMNKENAKAYAEGRAYPFPDVPSPSARKEIRAALKKTRDSQSTASRAEQGSSASQAGNATDDITPAPLSIPAAPGLSRPSQHDQRISETEQHSSFPPERRGPVMPPRVPSQQRLSLESGNRQPSQNLGTNSSGARSNQPLLSGPAQRRYSMEDLREERQSLRDTGSAPGDLNREHKERRNSNACNTDRAPRRSSSGSSCSWCCGSKPNVNED